MKLDVILGSDAYFFPKLIPGLLLNKACESLLGSVAVPGAPWIPDRTRSYHGLLFDEAQELRTALFLEYLEDCFGAEDRVTIVAPYEPCGLGRTSTISDPRVAALVEAARARLGAAAVRCVRLFLSERSERTLTMLDCHAVEPWSNDAAHDKVDVSMLELGGEALRDEPELLACMHRNYSHNVVKCGARSTRADSPFVRSDDGTAIAEHLDRCQLRVSLDLEPEEVLKSMQPGGPLQRLLTGI
jgi:hypothetical protein